LSLYLHGLHEKAESALREACRLEPRIADYRLALTLLYQRLERWSDALASATELCRLQPQNGSLQQLLGEIQAQAAAAGPNR
jgi:tetratricopeptide (TPR) repeat protein